MTKTKEQREYRGMNAMNPRGSGALITTTINNMNTQNLITIAIVALEIYVLLHALLYVAFLSWTDKLLRKKCKAKNLDIWTEHNKVRGKFFHCNIVTWPTYIKKYRSYVENL